VVGAIIGYLTTVTGARDYRAQALVYMGSRSGAISSSPIQALNTNQEAAHSIITSAAVVGQVARRVGMTPAGSGPEHGAGRPGLLHEAGPGAADQRDREGSEPAKVRLAANALASVLVSKLSRRRGRRSASSRSSGMPTSGRSSSRTRPQRSRPVRRARS
jgi:hypothetical protein